VALGHILETRTRLEHDLNQRMFLVRVAVEIVRWRSDARNAR
jgi:hypothetical protein